MEVERCGDEDNQLRVVSFNVNGIHKFRIDDILRRFKCSILALQETKIKRSKLSPIVALIDNYSSYFSFNQHKPQFNGVATYCKDSARPRKAEFHMADYNGQAPEDASDIIGGDYLSFNERFEQQVASFVDKDGRVIVTEHLVETSEGQQRRLIVFNLYSPYVNRQESEFDIEQSKTRKDIFERMVTRRAKSLVNDGAFVLIVGDLNTVHQTIDQAADLQQTEWDELYWERTKWIRELLEDGFKDTFRLMHPNRLKAFTCWNTQLLARQNNFGTRLDYILADDELSKYLIQADIHPDYMGSDHCPVSATFNLIPVPLGNYPKSATKFYDEFKKKQATLTEMFQKCEKPLSSQENCSSNSSHSTRVISEGSQKNEICRKRKSEFESTKQKKLSDFFVKKETSKNDDTSSSISSVENGPSEVSDINECSQTSIHFESQTKKSKTELFKWPNPPKVVLCKHNEPTVLKTVKKKGPNQGRSFYSCSRGIGAKDDPNGDCGFFSWK